jgi:hypothetical protein
MAHGLEMAIRSAVAPLYLAARWMSARGESYHEDIPRARLSLGLAAKIALDEIFFTSEMIAASFVSPADRRRIRAEIAAAEDFFEKEGFLDAPLRYHRTPPRLESPDLCSASSHGLRYTHLSFESGYEPLPGEPGRDRWLGYEQNRTAHAWMMQHPGPPRPWILCLHGYRMGVPLVDLAGFRAMWLHHKLGLNVLLPVLPLHGPRMKGSRSGDGFLTGDYMDTLHVQAQAMWDLRRLLSWVRLQDAPAAGAYGLSLGGYTAALLACLEADLDCVVAGIPATCFVRLADAHIPRLVHWMTEFVGLDWQGIRNVMRVVSPLAMPVRVAWENLFLFAGIADRLVPKEHVLDLWYHWDRPRILWYEGGHVSFRWEKPVKKLLKEALRSTGMIGVKTDERLQETATA